MMYDNKLAVALKSAGKVLREFKDTVYVPFGSEYSIFIKNMNSVRALVTVTVDGQDVGDGDQFVVGANDSIEIERFLKNGNLNKGNRLKFIERTGAVENHRGVGIEDGLVRVEFQFEKKLPKFEPSYPPYYVYPTIGSPDPYRPYWYSTTTNTVVGGSGTVSASNNVLRSRSANISQQSFSNSEGTFGEGEATMDCMFVADASAKAAVENDVGVTVEGSVSDQQFRTVSSFLTEAETHVIVLKMLGATKDNQPVKEAVTVKRKIKCKTCGHVNKGTAKFCAECGTSLQIV